MIQPRVRFAPSPTGDLHMGGARTALFNWLFARSNGGSFILRIEDTDRERSTEEATRGILDGLNWLGITWDEGPFYQSRRTHLYNDAVQRLLQSGNAYYDFSDPEKISFDRKQAQKASKAYRYDRHGMERDLETALKRIESGEKAAVRLYVPEGETRFHDMVAGEIEFRNETIEDFVLARSDGSPTYMLSVVVDDMDLKISHVIRGNDHISNTPKQILIYEALGAEPPLFAHLPLIHGPDKKKLSKRHGGTTVGEYMDKGFLPVAMLNFLALLGWSPGEDRELMSVPEMVEAFDFARVNKSAAIFDVEKLAWINSNAISASTGAELMPYFRAGLKEMNLWQNEYEQEKAEWIHQILDLVKERSRLTSDLAADSRYFFEAPEEYDEKAVTKRCKGEELPEHVEALAELLNGLDQWTAEEIERQLRELADRLSVGAGKLIHPLRIGVTGQGVTPDVFTICQLVGKEETIPRLRRFSDHLRRNR